MGPSGFDKLDPETRAIAERFARNRYELQREVERGRIRRRRLAFLRLLPRIVIGCAAFGLVGLGLGWVIIQLLKP